MADEKKKTNPGRLILLIVVLAAALGLSFMDRSARSATKERFDMIDQALVDGESIDNKQVAEWMGKSADRGYEAEGRKFIEEYDFGGLIRKQTVVVEYSVGAAKLVNKVSMK